MMKKKHFLGIFSFLIILLLVGGTLSLSTGYSHSSFLDILDMVAGRSNQSTLFIVSQIRLPRILATVVGGASLALAGFLLQTLTRNPLADSGILGINTGAGLAVAILVGLSNHIHPTSLGLYAPLCYAGWSFDHFDSLPHCKKEALWYPPNPIDYHRRRDFQYAFWNHGQYHQSLERLQNGVYSTVAQW